jgi:hypothetical protein
MKMMTSAICGERHHSVAAVRSWGAMDGQTDWLTMRKMMPMPAATLLLRSEFGKLGSRIPVTGFRSRKGALAANSGRGRSSSSWKPIQSQWCAKLTDLRFQYSRNVTAVGKASGCCLCSRHGMPSYFMFLCFETLYSFHCKGVNLRRICRPRRGAWFLDYAKYALPIHMLPEWYYNSSRRLVIPQLSPTSCSWNCVIE